MFAARSRSGSARELSGATRPWWIGIGTAKSASRHLSMCRSRRSAEPASTQSPAESTVIQKCVRWPWFREAAIYAIEHGSTTYTSNAGLPELRSQIAAHLCDRYHVRYNPADEIVVTVGVSEGLDLALRALLNPGDEVVYVEPCYVSYLPG